MNHTLFKPFTILAALLALALFANCTPLKSSKTAANEGKFEVNNASIYEQSGEFSLLDTVVYPEQTFKPFDSRINVPNKYLTLGDDKHSGRCNRCHECGFDDAWDTKHYQTPQWNPRYKGEEWKPVVQRMRKLNLSLLNETIADRIYSFLHDETLGTYDASKDTGPKPVIVDRTPPGAQTSRPTRPTP